MFRTFGTFIFSTFLIKTFLFAPLLGLSVKLMASLIKATRSLMKKFIPGDCSAILWSSRPVFRELVRILQPERRSAEKRERLRGSGTLREVG